jgi:hypothetical protein
MTESIESARRLAGADTASAPQRTALIGVAALLVILTNAIVFVLPPLLPAIQAEQPDRSRTVSP